jgi:SAM-dependent methyltransferase
MEQDAFELLAAGEREHWWFRGRRRLIERTLQYLAPGTTAQILDVGCGVGGNLELLARFGHVKGFESESGALTQARARHIGHLEPGALPTPLPFAGELFDIVGMFDVLEHLEHPVDCLAALRARMAEHGRLVITVPALPWLWGPHDEQHHHFRRYTRGQLVAHLEAAGFAVEYASYANMLLLPLAIAQRLKERLFGYSVHALTPPAWINALFYRVWSFESRFTPPGRLPIGLSVVAIARRAA